MSGRSVAELTAWAAEKLAVAGIATPRLDADVLLAHVLGVDRLDLALRRGDPVASAVVARFEDLIADRAERRPVAHLTGAKEFWSLNFAVGPAVLTPRPDSEALVAAVLARAVPAQRAWRILDLGTGSGCLLAALLHELPQATGIGVDISPDAAALAGENFAALGLDDRATVIVGDWLAPVVGERFDIIVANPPYIETAVIASLEPEVARYEPSLALDGGADGLQFYRRIASTAARMLSDGGLLAMEIGATQGTAVTALFATGWRDVVILPDLGRRDRVALATKP